MEYHLEKLVRWEKRQKNSRLGRSRLFSG